MSLWQCLGVQEKANDTFRSQGALVCCTTLKIVPNTSLSVPTPRRRPPPHQSWTFVSEFRLKAIWMSQITSKTFKQIFLSQSEHYFMYYESICSHWDWDWVTHNHDCHKGPCFESFKEILFLVIFFPKQTGKEQDPAVRAVDQVFVKVFNQSTIV